MSRPDDRPVENVRTIGAMSRESGLTVSALRFYDGAGLLTPAAVDPHNGYRSYADDQVPLARLVAVLRRVGMPLAGIRAVLDARHDPAAVAALIDGHLGALERGLADARRALSTVASLLETGDLVPTTATLPAADLVDALLAVRYAAGTDPELPVLASVLVDVAADGLTLVATDRYRLATATAPATVDGPDVAAVVPVELIDALLAGDPTGELTVTIGPGAVTFDSGGARVGGATRPDAFPDHRRLLPAPDTGTPVSSDLLRAALAADPGRQVREQDGVEFDVAEIDGVRVNREFLLQALDAGAAPTLALDGPLSPLMIRSERALALLMPVRG